MSLPLHPQQSIGAIEELVNDRMSTLWKQFSAALERSQQQFALTEDIQVLERFNEGADKMHQAILEWAAKTTPLVIKLIADAQRQS